MAHKSGKVSGRQVIPSKTDIVLKRLSSTKGTSVEEIMQVTGWQAHSVRGFLSGTVRKRLSLKLETDVGKDGARRYRIVRSAPAG
ncbi:MAG: DUF3489 domain-containing protein [Rhizobiaceae bacterium]|nr:DUF3489 domain-containing protein [Rhizobiaceae bacterium]